MSMFAAELKDWQLGRQIRKFA